MSLSLVSSTWRSKYTPGERTSWLTTTRSVPLMMKVPLADMSGKSPMKTVWLLISPVVLLMNSAVTNMGAENVMSLSLHSSAEYLGGSNRWSRNESDMVPEKSSIGLISSKISSRPDCSGTLVCPAALASLIRACHFSLPSSQSNDSVWSASRSGTFSGSRMRANETRPEPEFAAEVVVAEALRDAANRGPSELVAEISPHARQTPRGEDPVARGWNRGRQSAAQTSSVAEGQTACQVYATMRFTVAPRHSSLATKRQVQTGHSGHIACVTDATCGVRCRAQHARVGRLFRPRVGCLPADLAARRRGALRRFEAASRYGPGTGRGGRTRVRLRYLLLDRDRGAGALEGSPRLVRGLLVDLLEHGLGRAVNQVLRLLEAEAGQAAHLLDDLDLLLARGLEDDVELVLLLGLLGLAAAGAARGGGGPGAPGGPRDGKRGPRL